MSLTDLRLCRSLLFLPASNPRAITKARELAADMVVLDLEDAVKSADKLSAREAAVEAVAERFGGLSAIRINSDDRWRDADMEAVGASAVDYVIVPMTSGPDEVRRAADGTGKPVLAMVETAAGVLNAAAIAAEARALVAGTNDLSYSLGIPLGSHRAALATALQTILLAARAAGIAAFDGVYNRLDDAEGLEAECREGRSFGFDGKSVIHPGQVATANRLFGPSPEEVEKARRLIEAAGGGAQRHEGEMIEDLHVRQARRILAKARAEGAGAPGRGCL